MLQNRLIIDELTGKSLVSCFFDSQCISRYTGFAIQDDAYDVMLGLHHNAERRAVSPAALFSAAPDNDFLDFSHDDIFVHRHFCSLIYNNDDR